MKTTRMIRILALLAALPAWVYTTPAHAQQRRGRGSAGNDYQNRQPPMAPTGPAPLGGSSMGGFQNSGAFGLIPYPQAPLGGSSMGGIQNRQNGHVGSPPNLSPANLGGLNNTRGFNNGGLSNAFGNQSPHQYPYQYDPNVAAPNPGQPYQIPTQYAGHAPGTVITWGRYRYQLGSDGTMTSAGPIPGQHYQIPAQYANQPPGTVITKGRFRYQLGSDGTMTSYTGPETEIGEDGTETQQTSTGPVPGERYRIPAEHANAAPGSVLSYYGNHYVVSKDGTMTALSTSR